MKRSKGKVCRVGRPFSTWTTGLWAPQLIQLLINKEMPLSQCLLSQALYYVGMLAQVISPMTELSPQPLFLHKVRLAQRFRCLIMCLVFQGLSSHSEAIYWPQSDFISITKTLQLQEIPWVLNAPYRNWGQSPDILFTVSRVSFRIRKIHLLFLRNHQVLYIMMIQWKELWVLTLVQLLAISSASSNSQALYFSPGHLTFLSSAYFSVMAS